MTENVVGKSDWKNLIETLYRFEGSEMKIEETSEVGKSRRTRKATGKTEGFRGRRKPTRVEDSCKADPADP